MAIDPAKNSYTILVSGDSISRGVVFDEAKSRYALLPDSYVAIMRGLLKGAVYNLAHFGNTVTKGLSRLSGEVLKRKPDIVLLEFGGNDCDFNWPEVAARPEGEHLPRTDYARFRELLAAEVNGLKRGGVSPVLMTLPPIDAEKYLKRISGGAAAARANILKWLGSVTKLYWWQERYNSAIVGVAAETGAKLVDIRGAFLRRPDYQSLLCADGIHPNAAGHRVIAEGLVDYIRPNCPFLLKA